VYLVWAGMQKVGKTTTIRVLFNKYYNKKGLRLKKGCLRKRKTKLIEEYSKSIPEKA
jgi:hypothetical protein